MRKRIYLSLLSAVSLFAIKSTEAQIQTLSPYSSIGLGENATTNSQHFNDMGGTSIGMYSQNYLNLANPASFANIKLVNFEIGTYGKFTKYEQGNLSSAYNDVNFSQLSLGADIGPRAGLAFGFTPLSNHGYEVTNSPKQIDFSSSPNITDTVDYTTAFDGTGGINKLFAGGAYKINENFSVGAQVFYYFGNLVKNQEVEFNSSSYSSSRTESKISVKDVGFDFGLQYSKILVNENRLTLGATYTPKTSLSSKQTDYKYTYKNTSANQIVLDTVQFESRTNGDMDIPMSLGFGFSYAKPDKWMIGGDFRMTQWSDAKYFGTTPTGLKDEISMAIGGSYIPNKEDVRYFWNRVEYRGGLKYKSGNLELSSGSNAELTTINEIGINFGLGIPMRKTNSTLNLGFEFGQRGTTSNNLIKESYFKTYISFNFRDKWFVKRKID